LEKLFGKYSIHLEIRGLGKTEENQIILILNPLDKKPAVSIPDVYLGAGEFRLGKPGRKPFNYL
jgi:hypothetical protein